MTGRDEAGTVRLSQWQKKTLGTLIDKYEGSKTYSGENLVNQSFSVRPSDIYPEYESNYESIDRVHLFEDQMGFLERWGLVRIEKKREIISKIFLVTEPDRLAETYILLKREDRHSVIRKQKQFFSSQIGASRITDAFCKDQLLRLDQGKDPQYSIAEARALLKLLLRIIRNGEDILERELSIEVLGDSKEFEKSYRSRVCRILGKYADADQSPDGTGPDILESSDDPRACQRALLEEYGVYANPSYIYLKGKGTVTFSDGSVCLLRKDCPIAFLSETMKTVSRIEIDDHDLMTVENLTSFNRIRRDDTFFLYLGGYHNSAKRLFLKKIKADNETLSFYHFGDIDPDGFLILEHLRRKTGIGFQPYRMGTEEIVRYRKYCKTLEKHDCMKAENMLREGIFPEEMRYLLEHNVKLEQEIISWMER